MYPSTTSVSISQKNIVIFQKVRQSHWCDLEFYSLLQCFFATANILSFLALPKKAGFSPNTIGLYEAHGTGTVAGDKAELETIVKGLKANNSASKSCAIGSLKTAIGHTKSTAGVAGLVKAALSLHHKVLPPHIGVDTPLEAIADPGSPVYLLKEAQPWLAHPDYPRRSGVSAFGFGGTNFHAVLEE